MNGFPPGYQWDEEKNRQNIKVHKIDFRDAIGIFERPTVDRDDQLRTNREDRVNSVGALRDGKILNVTHTDRNGDTRIISARLATPHERRQYIEHAVALAPKKDEQRDKGASQAPAKSWAQAKADQAEVTKSDRDTPGDIDR